MFNGLKETIELTANQIKEDMRPELKKLQTEMSYLKKLVGKMENSLEGLISRMTVAEHRTSELQNEV